jgi:uncharacterized protein (DUF342 family)
MPDPDERNRSSESAPNLLPAGEPVATGGPPQEIVIEAVTLEAALNEAAKRLACRNSHVRHRLLQAPQKGVFGFGARPARIRAWRHDPLARHIDQALQTVRDMDGHFGIEIAGRDILLTVYPPIGAGRALTWKKILVAVKEFGPETIDELAVMQAVDEADTLPHAVAQIHEAGERDGRFLIRVSPDRMSADVTLIPPRKGGRDIVLGDLRDELVKEGIVFGVDSAAIEIARAEARYNTPIRIADGVAPVSPEPGRIRYTFQIDRHATVARADESGRIDHRELGLIQSVTAGDELARVIPPSGGSPGRDVYGNEIPAPPVAAAVLPEGENVLSDGVTLKAGIAGHVALVRGRVVVSPVYHVKGDVNYEVGNIDFEGTVCIDGLVEDAFTIRAGGSLFVRKSIGKCRVHAGGNVVVVGGILGRQEAEITAGGDLVALFVENAKLDVGGNLVVEEVILHSDALVGGDLVMSGARASLVGGVTIVGGDVTVRSIGGEATSRSNVRAGVPRELVLRERKDRAQIHDFEAKLVKIDEALKVVDQTSSGGDAAPGPLQARIAQLRATRAQMQARLRLLRDSLRSIDHEIDAHAARAAIHVIDMAMPGTRIEIGTASLVLNTPVQYATFRRHGGEVHVYPYEGSLGKP